MARADFQQKLRGQGLRVSSFTRDNVFHFIHRTETRLVLNGLTTFQSRLRVEVNDVKGSFEV